MVRIIEIWKDIKGYETYYQISSLGKIKSLDRYVTDKNGNPVSLCSTADNAKLVNGFNVETAVPSNAVFVDHSYSFSTGVCAVTFCFVRFRYK